MISHSLYFRTSERTSLFNKIQSHYIIPTVFHLYDNIYYQSFTRCEK